MKHTSTIKSFKSYCNSYYCPKYISEYVDGLSDDEFVLFYNEVYIAASYLIDENYLFYKMYWIMKCPWNNLSEELFIQLFFNIEGYDLSKIITDSKFNELYNYAKEVMESTNDIIRKQEYKDLKKKYTDYKEKLINSKCVDLSEVWLVDYWCNKNIKGLIQMPFSRHWIMHIEAINQIKSKLLTNGAKIVLKHFYFDIKKIQRGCPKT